MSWLRSREVIPHGERSSIRPKPVLPSVLAKGVSAATVGTLALALAACQTPAQQIKTVEVKVPVAVQPIKPAQVPAVPAPLAKRPPSLSAAADLLLAKVCELEAYALKADPLLRLSAGMPQQPLARFPECEK
jgi:hypothetical protein